MVKVIEKDVKGQNKADISLKKPSLPKNPKKVYTFLKRLKNPTYEEAIKRLPFEACLYTTNGSKKKGQNEVKIKKEVHVKTQPKWYTDLMEWEVNESTGEMFPKGVYTSNDFKCSNGKKIKSLDRFCKYYQPLYKQKKVTLWFLTFTQANKAKIPFNTMSKIVIQYFKRLGIDVRGHIWTAEVSDDLHWHYHMCVATDRVKLEGGKFPELLKFDNIWGRYTDIDFVKKDVRHYMAKYFAKCDYRVIGSRSYGCSRKLK
jgi:hypothetical protein